MNRLQRLQARRTAIVAKGQAGIAEAYTQIAESEAVRYAIGAMQPIDRAYTANTIAEGDRVREQLRSGLAALRLTPDYRYQGSVTNGTHIRAHSDIDLLVINLNFISLEPPLKASNPYTGNSSAEQAHLRSSTAAVLKAAFPAVTVDTSKGKCISLSGGSLRRKVDVVIANWWDTVEFELTKQETLRGVKIFDAGTLSSIENKPFLHNRRIEDRDLLLQGGVRKAARLLKSLKYDADTVLDISSYDVTSLAYAMPDAYVNVPRGEELRLVANCELFIRFLLANPTYRAQLMVPNKMRPIFGASGATESSLRRLYEELLGLIRDIEQGLARSFRKLEEARIHY